MSYSNTERYATARHEAIHCLAAVHFGIGVERVDVILGENSLTTAGRTSLRLPIEAYQIMQLVRKDPDHAVRIAIGVIAACSAPSVAERSPINASDLAPIDEFKKYWHCANPAWQSVCGEARRKVSAWLGQPKTGMTIQRLSQKLFCEGQLSGLRLRRAMEQAIDPTKAAPKPPAPTRNRAGLTPAEQKAAEEGLERLELFYGFKRPKSQKPLPPPTDMERVLEWLEQPYINFARRALYAPQKR